MLMKRRVSSHAPMVAGEVQGARYRSMVVVKPTATVKKMIGCCFDDDEEPAISIHKPKRPKNTAPPVNDTPVVKPTSPISSPVPSKRPIDAPSQYTGSPTPYRDKFSTRPRFSPNGRNLTLAFGTAAPEEFEIKKRMEPMGGTKSCTVQGVLSPSENRAASTPVVIKKPTTDPFCASGAESFRNEKEIYDKILTESTTRPLSHLMIPYATEADQFLLPLAVSLDKFTATVGSLQTADRTTVVYDIVNQALLGLQELHSLGYAHLDIKPDNMVIQHGAGILKLIDFGESLPLRTIGDIAKLKGAFHYRDLRGGSAPHRDLYSLGVVLEDLIQQFGINDPFLLIFPPALKRHVTVAAALTQFRTQFTDEMLAQARTLWSRILSMKVPE